MSRKDCRLPSIAVLASIAVAAWLALAPTAASAAVAPAPQPVSPGDGATFWEGVSVQFVVTGRGETSPGASSDDSRLFVKLATRPDTQGDGTLADAYVVYGLAYLSPANADRSQYRGSAPAEVFDPGTYYWQPYRHDCEADADCMQQGSVRRFTIFDPAAPSGPAPSPQRTGPRLKSFLVNTSFLPPGVSGRRFLDLAVKTGNSWGAFYRGNNIADPAERDGENTVGFSYAVPDDAAGAEINWVLKRYRRGKRRCRIHRHRSGRRHRHCRRGKRRKISQRVVERDILINAKTRWQAGPVYPKADEFDLEAVLAHEFGHFVGARHIYGCESSPMRHNIAPGDWWRARDDWFRSGCSGSPGAGLAAGRVASASVTSHGDDRPARLVHRRVVIEVTR